jgi:hypothetical protein
MTLNYDTFVFVKLKKWYDQTEQGCSEQLLQSSRLHDTKLISKCFIVFNVWRSPDSTTLVYRLADLSVFAFRKFSISSSGRKEAFDLFISAFFFWKSLLSSQITV